MNEIILHHYPASPFAEKVRLALGLKGLAWRSVLIPNMMPKPDLMPLTGGYRKTPVMQIGADIYCDSQCILAEVERRQPKPSLYPADWHGQAQALAWWADKALFAAAVGVVFATIGDKLPQAFKDDRAKFSGRDFDAARMHAALPALRDQLRAHLETLDAMFADGRDFLLGPRPSLADFAAYHPVWFVRNRLAKGASPLDGFPRILNWAERMRGIGHGNSREMSAADALQIAKDASPADMPAMEPSDPGGAKLGDQVKVTPDDTGRVPVAGELVASSAAKIVILRSDPAVGTVMVHFPRAGYQVAPA